MSRLGRVAAAVLLPAALVGCAERPPAPGPVMLVFKHARILGPADPIPALLREFEAANPGVRVRSEALPWTSDEQHQFYVVNLEGRRAGFDVLMLDVIWVPEFARAGWLLDLSGRVRDEERAAFFPSAMAAAAWDGRVWALPWNMNVGLLYYRADLLAKHGLQPPTTWDELEAQVARIRAAEGNARLDGYLWQGKQYEGMIVNALEAMWAAGTDVLAPDGGLFPEPGRAAAALTRLRGLIERGVSPPWLTAADEELTRRAFGDGRAIFLRNWPYALQLFEAEGSPVRGRVGVAPLPGGGRGSTGGSHLGVVRGTPHPDEAAALVRFLTGERAQRAMLAGTLYPARRALYRDPALVAAHPTLPRIHDLMLAGRPRPVTPHYLLLSTTLQPEFSAVLVGLKPATRAIADGRARLDYFLASRR
ncbi:MAG: ABC transporter substrate-binding protein [Candidatus Rokuibacteriota bacterium]